MGWLASTGGVGRWRARCAAKGLTAQRLGGDEEAAVGEESEGGGEHVGKEKCVATGQTAGPAALSAARLSGESGGVSSGDLTSETALSCGENSIMSAGPPSATAAGSDSGGGWVGADALLAMGCASAGLWSSFCARISVSSWRVSAPSWMRSARPVASKAFFQGWEKGPGGWRRCG